MINFAVHARRMLALTICALLAACGEAALSSTAANAGAPALSIPIAQLQKSLNCFGPDLSTAAHAPVLLVHGTAETAELEWSWNYVPALAALGWPVCTVSLPNKGMSDIQDSAEVVVYAIREMYRRSEKKVQIIGHSQGGMVPRWSLKYWPDTRAMVDDLVGLAASNHGTLDAVAACTPDCTAAFWQQRTGSAFITALNSGAETYPGIDYTSVYSHYDEVVIPNLDSTGSTSLKGSGANLINVATQDICPNNLAEHLAMGTYDPVAWAVALDALSNVGPGRPARIALTVCANATMPGVDQTAFAANNTANSAGIGATVDSIPPATPRTPLRSRR